MINQFVTWWTQLWPNIVADLLWALPGFTINHILLRRHHTTVVHQETARQTKELKAHIDAKIGGSPDGPHRL